MKDSGIEWIGEIPQEWETIKIKYLSPVLRGASPRPIDNPIYFNENGEYVWTRIADVSKCNRYFEKYYEYMSDLGTSKSIKIEPNSLIVSICATVGKPIITKVKCCIHDGFVYFPLLDPKYNDFLYYIFNNGSCFAGLGKLGTQLNLNTETVGSISIPIIDDSELKSIIKYLDEKCSEIDNIVENTKASIDEYKKYKQSVITEAVTKGLNPSVEMKDSGIEWNRHIPLHWKVVNGRRLFELRKDKAMPEDRQLTASQKYGIMYQDEFMQLENQRVVTVQKDFDILKHVEPNDFVISMRSFQGGLEYSQLRGCISSAYVMLIPNEKVYCPYFRWLFKSVKYINALQSTSNLVRDGQAMRFSNFVQIPLFLIPIDEQKRIADYLNAKCAEIDNIISKKQQIVTELENYKKSLIYECVTGKRSVQTEENNQTTMTVYPLFPVLLATDKKRFAQAVLASKIIDMTNTSQFGRVKLEKILYTVETHIGFDFDTDYKRQVAGPLDGSIYQCESMISKRNKWFNINENKKAVEYSPAKDIANYNNYYNKYFVDYSTEIERIINIFKPLSTDQAEIIATLYASWNDFIIIGKAFTDEDIVNDVLNNWHDSKKRFSKDIWLCTIDQMRKLDLVPKGYGKKTAMA